MVGAALKIVDEQGLGALTIRALAERLSLTPMAIYRHVANKDALLDALVDGLLGGLELPDPAAAWAQRLLHLAHEGRRLVHRHPQAAVLLFTRPTQTPQAVAFVDAIYRALLDAGVPEAVVPRLERLASTFVLGYAVSEVNGRFRAADESRGRRGGGQPAHRRLEAILSKEVDWTAEFSADLGDLITLIRLAAGTGHPRDELRGPAGGGPPDPSTAGTAGAPGEGTAARADRRHP